MFNFVFVKFYKPRRYLSKRMFVVGYMFLKVRRDVVVDGHIWELSTHRPASMWQPHT